MPWRKSTQVHHCTVCEELSTAACPRCGRYLCAQHSPESDEVCEGCEADFDHRVGALIKPQPKPLKGAFKRVVAYPSLGLGTLASMVTLVAGVAGGAGLAAFAWALGALLYGTLFGALVTIPAYLIFGAPIFARRKLKAAAQETRLLLARRRFDRERNLLPDPNADAIRSDDRERNLLPDPNADAIRSDDSES